jgi:hypothetical protein
VRFTSRAGKRVKAWPDYWTQFRELVDLAYDRYGRCTQITIFADAQLMPEKAARVAHMRHSATLLGDCRSARAIGLQRLGSRMAAALRCFPRGLLECPSNRASHCGMPHCCGTPLLSWGIAGVPEPSGFSVWEAASLRHCATVRIGALPTNVALQAGSRRPPVNLSSLRVLGVHLRICHPERREGSLPAGSGALACATGSGTGAFALIYRRHRSDCVALGRDPSLRSG